jgi:hypothetical protein
MVTRLENPQEKAKDERRVPPGQVAAAAGRGPVLWGEALKSWKEV